MRGLLGEGALLSKSRFGVWGGAAWSRRLLEDREVVYMWADGIYVKVDAHTEALKEWTRDRVPLH